MQTRRGQFVDPRVREAGLKDVAEKIYRRFRDWSITERLVGRIKKYLKTRNNNDDLSPSDAAEIYRRDEYGDVFPLSKKRRLDIDWSAHAEYRSDLRDVHPQKVNNGILEWLRNRLMTKGPDSKTVRMKLPGTGTAVVDYDLRRSPADAKVVTVWASDMPRFKSRMLQKAIMRMREFDRPDLSGEDYIVGAFDWDGGDALAIASARSKSAAMQIVRTYQGDERVWMVVVERPGVGVKSWIRKESGSWRTKVGSRRASDKTAARVMTEDSYILSKGVNTFPPGEPGLHRTPRRIPKSQQRENSKIIMQRQDAWQKQIDFLRTEYRQKVMDGEIRPPSRIERLLGRAKGHPDLGSVQAARRILQKQGLWTDEMEKESDRRFMARVGAMTDRIAEDVLSSYVCRASVVGFISDYRSKTYSHPLDPSMRVWSFAKKDGERLPLIMTELSKKRWDGEEVVWFHAIISPEKQGTGIASHVLKQIAKIADENGTTIWVAPKPFGTVENKLKKSQLVAWYKRNGWENASAGQMVRRPR